MTPNARRGQNRVWRGQIATITLIFTFLDQGYLLAQPTPLERAKATIGHTNHFNHDGANWCADYVVTMAGERLPVSPSRSAKQLYQRFKAAGLVVSQPQPGDLVFFWRESPQSWKGHTGIVEAVSSTTLTTIEGNVGRIVQRRTYARHAIPRLLGFGRL